MTGSVSSPIFYPDSNVGKILWNSSFLDKIATLIFSIRLNFIYEFNEQLENALIKKHFGPNISTIGELRNNVQMVFLNTYEFLDFSRSVPNSVVYTGGMHLP